MSKGLLAVLVALAALLGVSGPVLAGRYWPTPQKVRHTIHLVAVSTAEDDLVVKATGGVIRGAAVGSHVPEPGDVYLHRESLYDNHGVEIGHGRIDCTVHTFDLTTSDGELTCDGATEITDKGTLYAMDLFHVSDLGHGLEGPIVGGDGIFAGWDGDFTVSAWLTPDTTDDPAERTRRYEFRLRK